jgi:hypothetical protein
MVHGVGNTDTPATLDSQDVDFSIKHKSGDLIEIDLMANSKFVKNLFEKKLVSEGKTPTEAKEALSLVTEDPLGEKIKIKYFPSSGSTTSVKGSLTKASTGNSKEDKSIITGQILGNSKTIQYTGLLLVIAGAGIAILLKQRTQGALVGLVGVGLVILQATLANPIWSWVMVGVLVVLPLFWLYKSYKQGNLNISLVKSIEKIKAAAPEKITEIKDILKEEVSPMRKEIDKIKSENIK